MEAFLKVLPFIFEGFLSAVFQPLFWIVVLMVAFLNLRQIRLKETLFGIKDESLLFYTSLSFFYGLVGGLIGSFLMILFGVSIIEIGISYLWIIALVLMLVHPRFLCFSYAGGLLSLSSILFGFPNIDVPQLMGLVAILHMVESLLILSSGHVGAIPIYIRNDRGELVGGFSLQMYWPIPIVTLLIMSKSIFPGEWLNMPQWWPLIKPDIQGSLDNILYVIYPVVAALGYGDIALAHFPKEKVRKAALNLAAYSLILLFMCVVVSNYRTATLYLLPALFGPVGHEIIVHIGQRQELRGRPLFINPPEGIKVLEVLKGSFADRLGLSTCDVILKINDIPVNTKKELQEAFDINPWWAAVEYLKAADKRIRVDTIKKRLNEPFGIIPAPTPLDQPNIFINQKGFLAEKLKKLKELFIRRRKQ
ncbi:MAG TPA: PDZ domain-containing protein [Peptococcaceae bacterium]|nr:MAG: PDZ/DHR/GLGF domain-containing protein [Clostridia bacterium 41_269]HBT20861.1 PDZ domain-containing protein [Peptococcaceae bacterium]